MGPQYSFAGPTAHHNSTVKAGLKDLADEERLAHVTRAFKQVSQLWSFAGRLWSGVLPCKLRERALAVQIGAAFEWAADALLSLEDVGADEATEIATLFTNWQHAALDVLYPIDEDVSFLLLGHFLFYLFSQVLIISIP